MYERFIMDGRRYPELGRKDELQYNIEKYLQMPRTLILKLDHERRGCTCTRMPMEEIQKPEYEHTTHILFQWHQINKTEEKFELPLDLSFNDGTHFGIRLAPYENEPYTIDYIDGNFYLVSDDEILEEVNVGSRPKYYDKLTSSGIPMQYIAIAKPSDACIFIPYRYCHYWSSNDNCRFCDMNYNTKLQMSLGRGFTTRSEPQDIYETTLEILKEDGRWRHLCITGGSDPRESYDREFEFYLSCAKAIQKGFKEIYNIDEIPLYLVLTPYSREQMRILREEAGVTRFGANLEVWDPDKFPLICPGKEKSMSREKWIERMIEGVEIFGEGNMECAFVTGVIMAPSPYGYNDLDRAVESDLEGIKFCIDNHIKPVSYNWTIEPGSYFYKIGAMQPPLEFYISVELGRFNMFKEYEKKNGHAFPFGATDFRCCPWSVSIDLERLL